MLNSMTGFGRASGQCVGLAWSWELRCVNGKGMDIRLRLPAGYEYLEANVRKRLARGILRGNVQASLSLGNGSARSVASLNEDVLACALAAIEKIEAESNRRPSSAAEILNVRGVFDTSEPPLPDAVQEELEAALLDGLEHAAEHINRNRAQEGQVLARVLLGHLQIIGELVEAAETDEALSQTAITSRLDRQIAQVTGTGDQFERDRLYQEVALLATKADIREELDRLKAHAIAAAELIRKGSPAGRKLEFLAQEFNRECNTICSKANALSLKETGLELKVVIDQFREQCLNVE